MSLKEDYEEKLILFIEVSVIHFDGCNVLKPQQNFTVTLAYPVITDV